MWSLTKVTTVLSVFYGMFVGGCYGLTGMLFAGMFNANLSANTSEVMATQWAMVGGGVVLGGLGGLTGGLIGGLILALVVNIALAVSRGLELEVEAPELIGLPREA